MWQQRRLGFETQGLIGRMPVRVTVAVQTAITSISWQRQQEYVITSDAWWHVCKSSNMFLMACQHVDCKSWASKYIQMKCKKPLPVSSNMVAIQSTTSFSIPRLFVKLAVDTLAADMQMRNVNMKSEATTLCCIGVVLRAVWRHSSDGVTVQTRRRIFAAKCSV